MGYFSRLSLTLMERASYEVESLSKRERLQNRINELKDRLDDFARAAGRVGYKPPFGMILDRRIMCRGDLRYIVPEELRTYEEVLLALTVAEDELGLLSRGYISSVTVLIPGQMLLKV